MPFLSLSFSHYTCYYNACYFSYTSWNLVPSVSFCLGSENTLRRWNAVLHDYCWKYCLTIYLVMWKTFCWNLCYYRIYCLVVDICFIFITIKLLCFLEIYLFYSQARYFRWNFSNINSKDATYDVSLEQLIYLIILSKVFDSELKAEAMSC